MFWYNADVEFLEKKEIAVAADKQRLLFYGSSSIRLWKTAQHDFPDFQVMNQGFGGSTLAACAWFFKRLVPKFNPDILVVYAGDNDLGDGRTPEEVYHFFKGLMQLKNELCGNIPMAFISVKPSPKRSHLIKSIEYTNKIIQQEILAKHPDCTFVNVFDEMHAAKDSSLYESDGLHMNGKGYQLWTRTLNETFFTNLRLAKYEERVSQMV